MATCKECYHWCLCKDDGVFYSQGAEGCSSWADKELIENLLRMNAIKNVHPEQVKHRIVKSMGEFREDVRAAVHQSAYPFLHQGKIEFFDDIGYRSKCETMSRLSAYYGVEVIEVDTDGVDILIEFGNKKED